MNMHPEDYPPQGHDFSSEKFRHKIRNEAHAIWLGTRLLMEHLKKDNTDEAILVCEALMESAGNMKKLTEVR